MKTFLSRTIYLALLLFATLTRSISSSGIRLLVVLEDAVLSNAYSKFWADLKSRGYALDFQSPKSPQLALFKLGERSYDHIILLPPTSKAYGNSLSPQILLEFIQAGGNILLALSGQSPVPTQIVSFLLELDIHLPHDRNSVVVDHFNYDSITAPELHDVLLVLTPLSLRPDVKNYFEGHDDKPLVVPRAVPQVPGNNARLLVPILRATSTSYVYNTKESADNDVEEQELASGSQLALVSALQARNSARVSILGSAEMLQDKWFDATVKRGSKVAKVGNRVFSQQLSAWVFKEVGVLKVGRLVHQQANQSDLDFSIGSALKDANPEMYRIKSDIKFAIEISEYHGSSLHPYNPPDADAVQLEVTMLSPFYRVPLDVISRTTNSTIFGTSLTLPDQHGIFNFRVNYKRPFLTSVDEKRQFTLRHFAHDEYPRSWQISSAWPWIAGIWVTVIAWVVFVTIWLWSAPTASTSTSVKKIQ